ncbi:MAG: HAD-IB family phosphatase [Fidelibacterota bacterium]
MIHKAISLEVWQVKYNIENLIIDFDGTIVSVEIMEVLFEFALENNTRKHEILEMVRDITKKGMEGKIPFSESLSRRISLLGSLNQQVLNNAAEYINSRVSPSFRKNVEFFRDELNTYVVSGGFTQVIYPVTDELGIPRDKVFANRLIFDGENNLVGVDNSNLLAGDRGKVRLFRNLNLKGSTAVVGDGFNDYELKLEGVANYFFAYCEFVSRSDVMEKADAVVYDFNELLGLISGAQPPLAKCGI